MRDAQENSWKNTTGRHTCGAQRREAMEKKNCPHIDLELLESRALGK